MPDTSETNAGMIPVHEGFRPGGTYRITVWPTDATPPPPLQSPGVRMYAGGEVYITVVEQDTPGSPLSEYVRVTDPTPVPFTRDAVDTFVAEFQVTVSDDAPAVDLEIQIQYVEPGKRQFGCSLKVPLLSDIQPMDPSLRRYVDINEGVGLDATPAEQVAIMYVEAAESGRVRLRGWHRKSKLAVTPAVPLPEKNLADFVEDQIGPEEVRNAVRNFSRRCPPELLSWLQGLHQRYGSELSLLIISLAHADLPWEMVELQDDAYLGAQMNVIRWIPAPFYTQIRQMAIRPEQQQGRIIAFIDSTGLGHDNTILERTHLARFDAKLCSTPDVFKEELASASGAGLVYVASHGTFVYNERHEQALGDLLTRDPKQRIAFLDMEGLGQIEQGRPMFVVNACHSARLFHDGQGLFGLPEVLLARVADVYVGTLGPVGSAQAAAVSARLFEACASEPSGVAVSELLRRLRQEAAEAVQRDRSKASFLRLLYTFMYVYFGNPFTRLRLAMTTDAADASHGEADE